MEHQPQRPSRSRSLPSVSWGDSVHRPSHRIRAHACSHVQVDPAPEPGAVCLQGGHSPSAHRTGSPPPEPSSAPPQQLPRPRPGSRPLGPSRRGRPPCKVRGAKELTKGQGHRSPRAEAMSLGESPGDGLQSWNGRHRTGSALTCHGGGPAGPPPGRPKIVRKWAAPALGDSLGDSRRPLSLAPPTPQVPPS